jgi:SsrA-binding protein
LVLVPKESRNDSKAAFVTASEFVPRRFNLVKTCPARRVWTTLSTRLQPEAGYAVNVVTFFLPMARQSTHQTKPNPEKNPRRDPTAAGERDAAVNRIASHNYFLLEKFETGVVLTGTEVKSIRTGHANLKDSYGLVKDAELWLLNAHIGPYDHGNIFNHAPLRTRKLLVHKDELRKLIGKTQQKGLTLIPTRMYFKNGRVKVELALAKGKQLWDKRETERRRTADKEAREAISRGRKRAG